MVQSLALGRPLYGFPNSRCLSQPGSSPERPSSCLLDCCARAWAPGSFGPPMPRGLSWCFPSRHQLRG
eukprot:13957873-Alexandrium_andersonii.AAC.1